MFVSTMPITLANLGTCVTFCSIISLFETSYSFANESSEHSPIIVQSQGRRIHEPASQVHQSFFMDDVSGVFDDEPLGPIIYGLDPLFFLEHARDRFSSIGTQAPLETSPLDPSDPQGQQGHTHAGYLDPVVPIRDDGTLTRPTTSEARPGSLNAGSDYPAHHTESEAAITVNDIAGAFTLFVWTIKTVEEKAQSLFRLVESLHRKCEPLLNNVMGIDSTEDSSASMYAQIQAAMLSYSDLVSSIREGMASIDLEMNAQINRVIHAKLPTSQSIHLRAVAINLSVMHQVFLLKASFRPNKNSTVDAIRRKVKAYLQNLCPGETHITHFNSPQVADAAIRDRMQQNRRLTEDYAEVILNRCNLDIAAQIANTTSINRIHYYEATIEVLKQGTMDLGSTSAIYCGELVQMNPPCSSS